jgi:hydroxymethylpyrimidine/phosphomethylpyrimidine kinase
VYRPRVLVLGGLDPCGGAGITADARVLELHGCHPLTVATCLTVQNRFGFTAAQAVPAALFAGALGAAMADGPLHAVKLGLFADAATLLDAASALATLQLPTVIDPVLSATAGGYVAGEPLRQAYREAGGALRAVLTPNLPELEQLAAAGGAAELLAAGCSVVVAKGGHTGGAEVIDRVFTPQGMTPIRHGRAPSGPVHGTGCAFAAALAAGLAHGKAVLTAVAVAAHWVGGCLDAMGPSSESYPRPFVPRPPRE